MKALVVKAYGKEANITIETKNDPIPRAGEAIVKVYAAALNPLDLTVKSGLLPFAKSAPIILGNEGAGVVVGGSTKYAKGTKVIIQGGSLGVTEDGTFQELIAIPEEQLVKLPENYTFVEGASLSVAYLTAYLALTYSGQLQQGEWVAIGGATGGVGNAGIQLAKALGAKPIAIVSSDEKAKQALAAEPTAVINLSQEGIVEGIDRITNGNGINLAIDPVGGDATIQLLQSLTQDGRLVSIGYASGMEIKLNLMDLLAKTRRIIGFSIYNVPQDVTYQALQHIVELAEAGHVRPVVDSSFELDQWDQAIARLTSRKAIGKVVFSMKQ